MGWAAEGAAQQTAPAAGETPPAAAPGDFALDQYDEIRDFPEPTRTEQQKIQAMLTQAYKDARFNSPDDENKARAYFRFRAAEFTWPERLKDLPRKRKEIGIICRTCFSANGQDRNIHLWLNNELLTNFRAIATNAGDRKYHPAARYNAMLVIGDLNQVEPDVSGRGAEPWPKALETLTATVNDDTQLEAVRIAAMDGLRRHAELGKAPDVRRQLAPLLSGIAKTRKPSGKLQPAALCWMRRRAVQGLTAMALQGAPEANRLECVNAVRDVLEDDSLSLLARADAAQALGAFDKSAIGTARIAADLEALTRFVVSAGQVKPGAGHVNPDWLAYYFSAAYWGLQGYSVNERNQLVPDDNRGLRNAAANDRTAKEAVANLTARVGELIRVCTAKNFNANDLAAKINELAKTINPQGSGAVAAGKS